MFTENKSLYFQSSLVFKVIIPVLLLMAASGCQQEQSAVAEQPIPKVTTTAVVQQETTDYDEYTGKTEAFESVEVRRARVRLPKVDRVQRWRFCQGRADSVHDRA